MNKEDRAKKVNQLVKVIGDGGRHFFNYQGRYARIEVDYRGRVWWIDNYTQKRIYTHYGHRWRGFSNGGTLRSLVEAFRDFVSRGDYVPRYHFGPWPDHYCHGDLWGYGDYMKKVRNAAVDLGVTRASE